MVAVIDALKRIAEDGAQHKLLREEFNTFITKKGIFSLAAVQANAVTMNAIDWWFNYGSETPHLAKVAKKVLPSQLVAPLLRGIGVHTRTYIMSRETG